MKLRPLGQSGFEVSVLSFGAWPLGDPDYWGTDAEADAEASVEAAIDAGINLFDTAETYGGGESERVLGELLGGKRDQVLIASKVSQENCAPEKLRASCEASLKRLGTDRLDLYQVHWPNREVPFADTCGEMMRLKEEGKIRAIGLSNFGKQDLLEWLGEGEAVSDQLGYNMAFRSPEFEIVPACRIQKVGVLAYMGLMQGILSGRWKKVDDIPAPRRRTRHFSHKREGARHQERGCEAVLMDTINRIDWFAQAVGVPLATVCLCWLLSQPGVTSVILGARKPEQFKANLEAASLDIGPAAIAQLNEISGTLKTYLGWNSDMWLSADERRIV